MIHLNSSAIRASLYMSMCLGTVAGCGQAGSDLIIKSAEQGVSTEVWADNWFEMYIDGEKVLEDSVAITTERSFNVETAIFSAQLPAVVAIMARDFKQDDTGLEYIGTDRQQMGDGGLIAQFHDVGFGKLLGVTDSATKCLVVHRAPLDKACANETNPVAGEGPCGFVASDIPVDWAAPSFDDSDWPSATEYSASEVRPKDGYDEIKWEPSAKLIWSDSLLQDNTLLCRLMIRR